MQPKTSYISVTDQFCGAGGSSLGAQSALGDKGQIILALNHNKIAIETHATNFPKTIHVRDEMNRCDPRNFPSTDILITSPECTNHSLAKGVRRKNQGQLNLFDSNDFDPDEERSRATMWDVPRFAEYHNYRIIIVENVVDARYWRMFDAWIMAMKALDYLHEIVYFNSMFAHPTPQSRDRMYVVFWKKGNRKPDLKFHPSAWCPTCETNVDAVQSWKNVKKQWGKYGVRNQYVYRCPTCANIVTPYYYCAANAIDWSLVGERIGDRKKPLKPRTIERIEYGLKRFGKQAQWVQVEYGHTRTAKPMTDAFPTQNVRQTLGMLLPSILVQTDYSHSESNRARLLSEVSPTQSARQVLSVISTPVVMRYDGTHMREVTREFSTLTTRDCMAVATPAFLANYYGKSMSTDITDPMGTVTTRDRAALVQPEPDLRVEDCFFRMLQPHEIGAAMAFPGDYIVLGNSRQKVKQYGNAVTPPVMQQLVERCAATLR